MNHPFVPQFISTPRIPSLGVTIAILNWNQEAVLPRAITSARKAATVLRSYNVAVEILVIDHGSNDGSITLMRQLEALYFEEGLRLWALADHQSPGYGRNQTLSLASYRYVVILDADNEIIPENIYQFYRAINETQATVVYGNLLRPDNEARRSFLINHESFQHRMFSQNYIDVFALVDRLAVLENGGFTTGGVGAIPEDWELYLRLAARGHRLVFVPLTLGIYHDLPNSLSKEIVADDHYLEIILSQVKRAFDQVEARSQLPLNTHLLQYHPDVGYL